MSKRLSKTRSTLLRGSALMIAMTALTACSEGQMPEFLQAKPGGEEAVGRADTSFQAAGETVERDVEAPEIFAAKESGLWDGRPSLGGVWVAHPDVKEPERAIIRNEKNGKFVIGALFRRERESPGPRVQISSDAAAALGILAGQPSNLDVVALRREEVAVDPAPDLAGMPEAPQDLVEDAAAAVPAAPEVSEGAIDPVVSGAAAAIETASLEPPTKAAPAPKPAAPRAASSALSKPFVQIGIFSIEQNARNTATAMRQAGMVPTVKEQSASGKTFWRVIVGPVQNKGELSALLKSIKQTGFTDAYAVSN